MSLGVSSTVIAHIFYYLDVSARNQLKKQLHLNSLLQGGSGKDQVSCLQQERAASVL